MAIIGGILAFVAGIACLIFWIMAIVKAFKAGDTLWGVLSIFIGICGLIYLFMKGQTKLAIYWIIAMVIAGIGYGIGMAGAINQAGGLEGLQTMPQ
ncbi:MAG: hypothetical protein CMO55_11855 [Verrucomicrobiales bacterium]|nr:hypothetical protein [Verrucomicrobiales bacterium]